MKKHSLVFLNAALLLLAAGCVTTGIDTGRGIDPDREIDALVDDFIARYSSRFEQYLNEAKTTNAKVTRWLGVDNERARRSLDRHMELVGRMRFHANFEDKTGGERR